MNIIFSTIIAIIILLFAILAAVFSAWLDRKDKEALIEKTLDRKEAFIDKAIEKVLAKTMDQHKTGPWYLVVYTIDNDFPIWVSNNNIRSVHPDPENRKIVIKQFCNEDMVIENVISYELCSGNDLCEYDM